jgi:hypothetical protein
MNNWFKRNGIHLAIMAIFLGICFFFLTPSFQGKTFLQNDVTGAQATQKEIMDYKAKDTTILWTNQTLGGMPTFQLWGSYPKNITTHIFKVVKAVFPDPVVIMLLLLCGSYFLFNVLKLNPWLAAAGAVAVTFSSYNIIYMVAGHTNQDYAIAFFPFIIASILMTLRGKYLAGASLTAFFLALEIRSNHVQMTYYLLIALLILVIIELVSAIRSKNLQPFYKSFAWLAGAIVLGVAVNTSILWSTYEYGKDSIRGKSNLTSKMVDEAGDGVPRDYAYEYSEGIGELATVLVPNVYGGGGLTPLLDDSHITKSLTDAGVDPGQAQQFAQGLAQRYYWGDKTLTEGPWYFGAVVCFLFVLGIIIVKDKIKWWLLATIILTVLLSFGKHLSAVSDLFFNYFPLYNKFRTVESILVIASLCFPILAFLAIKEIIDAADKKALVKKALLALYITGGLTLIIAVVPTIFFSFRADDHQTLINQLTQIFKGNSSVANSIGNALVKDRQSLAQADAIRSLIFIGLAFGLVWLYLTDKIKTTVLSASFLVLTLADLWLIDKRYLNDNSYRDAQESSTPQPRQVETFITRDPDPDFRVFDASQSIFQDQFTPFFYKSLGGYSAARMKRYDELVKYQFKNAIPHDVLDMLNVKYIITPNPSSQAGGQGGNQDVGMQRNRTACGNAWFVQHVTYVKNSDQEMQAISSFDPKTTAIIDQQYKSLIDEKQNAVDTAATIKLTHYNPDHMTYEFGTSTRQIAVFSEIYYNRGWKMFIDGKEAPYFRADYLLRAAQLPVGNHKLEFIFHPASYYAGEDISLAASILLVVGLAGAGYTGIRNKKEKEKKKV